ncbi:MAG: DUF2118 domain-containing protein [Desulfurococcales archaeon]|nr:DUF2118 domain-containing protein [Desulfurococcales archaeon]
MYRPSDYQFPRVYVEGAESGECLVLDDGRARIEKPCKRGMGLVPYESGFEMTIDPVEAVVKRSYAIYIPSRGEVLIVPRGTRVYLVEALGVQVNHVALEGDTVKPGSILAYILTGKGETRTLRSGVEGVIIYIGWGLEGELNRYIYVIAREGVERVMVDGA